jgi:glycosyltransferase involved in cell wall biosynthesis
MNKVLFFSGWYPNRNDKMSGLFVRKHAQAVSLYCEVQVLYVHPSPELVKLEIEQKQIGNIKETVVYFPAKSNSIFNKTIKQINYLRAYQKGWKKIKTSGFTPNIIHVNILSRTGFVAYLIKIMTGIPFVVSEHWSRYLPLRNTYHGFLRKQITNLVAKNADAIFPVSRNLKQAMLSQGIYNKNYKVVNNTVDDFFFEHIERKTDLNAKILHVSCFDELAKNIKGILNTVKELSKKRTDFELILIGDGVDFNEIYQYSLALDFPEGMIHFVGEKAPIEVAKYMQNSDFFVLFSNYENSPVVISESLACGKPVISSDVGGINEHINESNGILIPAKDENALLGSLNYMLDHYKSFDAAAIRSTALEKFSANNVGALISNSYKDILKRHS